MNQNSFYSEMINITSIVKSNLEKKKGKCICYCYISMSYLELFKFREHCKIC